MALLYMLCSIAPLGLAVQNRHASAVTTLLNLGADPFDGKSHSLYNTNPACPYWLALDVKLKVEAFGRVTWQRDEAVLTCNQCDKRFTLFDRRHHCRFCGEIVCASCSNFKIYGLRACKRCNKKKNDSSDSRDFFWRARQSKHNRARYLGVQSQSSYRMPQVHLLNKGRNSYYSSDGVLNLLEIVDLKRRQMMNVPTLEDLLKSMNHQRERRTSLKQQRQSINWKVLKKSITTKPVHTKSLQDVVKRMMEKVIEEGDKAFRWHIAYSEGRRRQSHVMESWMVRCKLLDFRKRNAEMSKLSRSPSRTLREILNVNDSNNSLYGLIRETIVCCRNNNNNFIHRQRQGRRVARGSINVINASSNQMHAVDYETYKKHKKLQKNKVNSLMQKHNSVQIMRKEYGRIDFYIEIVTICISFFTGLYFFHVSLNPYRGENRAPMLISEMTIGENPAGNLYNQIDRNDPDTLYTWLQDGYFKYSLPSIRSTYYQVGKISITQERFATLQGSGLAGPRYVNSQVGNVNLEWGKRKALVTNNNGHVNNNTVIKFKCNEYSPSRDEQIYYNELSTDKSERYNYINQLKNYSFIDNKTKAVEINSLFYSNNLDIYTQASMRFEYSPSGVLIPSIFYKNFHPMDFTNTNQNEKTGYYIAFSLFLFSNISELIYIMYRFWRRTVEVQRFIYDNKLISYMDENSMEKKEKTMSTLNVVRNNILYIRNKFFVQRDAKFWYNIVSSFSLIYFLSVLEPCGYRFISKLEETIDVNTHLIKLKDDGNGNLHADINTFISTIEIATWCVIIYIMMFALCVLTEMQRHPDFGNLVLAVKHTLFSSNVTSFFLLLVVCMFCFVLMFRMLIGDSRLDWFGLNALLPLFAFFITGDHDPEYYFSQHEGSSFIYILFLLFVILFFLNLFIAVLNSVWEKTIATSLWDIEIDERIRTHVKAYMSDADPHNSIIIKYLYEIVYGFEHKGRRNKRIGKRYKLWFEIAFLIYLVLFIIFIVLVVSNKQWFFFDFENARQAIIIVVVLLLFFTGSIINKKFNKKEEISRKKLKLPL